MDAETSITEQPSHTTRRSFVRHAGLVGIGAAGATGLMAMTSLTGLAEDRGTIWRQPPSGHGQGQSLRDAMRRVWEDHIAWTRMFIISFASELPDLDLVAGRLLRNQDEIGDFFRPVFGDDAGDAVAALLREHILGAADLLGAAKEGVGAQDAIDAWYANGDDIARALSELNPRSWPFEEMQTMMHAHLDPTLAEGVALLEGRFADGIDLWDTIHDQALMMADMLTVGLHTAPRRH